MFSEFQQKVETLRRALQPLHFVGYAYIQSATIYLYIQLREKYRLTRYTNHFFSNWGYSKKDSKTIISKFGLFIINVLFYFSYEDNLK